MTMTTRNPYDLDFTRGAEPLKVVVTPTTDAYDPAVMVFEITLSDEGFIIDFHQDGECVATSARTWQEWIDSNIIEKDFRT